MHPKECRLRANRREFLIRSGGAAAALSGLSGVLAACSSSTNAGAVSTNAQGQLLGPGGLPLARPDRRVMLPRFEDPIPSGMKPETGGTFNVFNYPDYIDPALLKAFGKQYGVKVLVTPYDDINTGIT